MKAVFERPLRNYVLGLLLLTITVGVLLWRADADIYMLIPVIAIQLIVLIIILLHMSERYIKPLDKTIETVDRLVKGDFRARIHQPASGQMSDLNDKINSLARNLSQLSIHEQMQKEQLATIVDNVEIGLVLIDEKGYIHYVNRKFTDTFGKQTKAYHGHLYYDVINNEKIHTLVQETFLYESNIKSQFVIRKDLLKEVFLEIVGVPIFNERTQLRGAVLVLYDISELKKLEVMRKDFVANVSHELKTPMTSIKGFAETLLDGAMDDPEALQEFLKIIYDESNRLQFLIDDLLTLSRLENDGFKISAEKVKLAALVQEIEPLIRHKAEKKEIRLTVEVEEEAEAVFDRERIKQVMINLLDNAINYTPEGGDVKLRVQVDSELIMQVEDTGIGIEEEAIPRLFERFYRVDKARSRNTGGTGLGLAIVKHIVELHKGNIKLHSVPGEGSVFTINIPGKR
ncbi:ATP-binding protein [Aciduricibacillus chroicocephali]|uniref:histidine kinase n=1 Tax=Aciduricibacillus chroicocephali TaxID=3054939 RepID=A0ABY9KVI8_9BACI|nr:ATP-binding protein [Bacillaceae bacterium 44XB]